jgi:hypothetical protein
LLLGLFLTGCARSNAPKLLTDARPDWGPTYRLTDGVYEVHISPEIGRVMHFSRVGEPNLLWTNPVPQTISSEQWPNFGGDKLWPWPQNDGGWGWPPPAEVDRGPYKLEPVPDGVRLQGAQNPTRGMLGERFTRFSHDRVQSTYSLTAAQPQKLPLAAWSVVQVPAVDAVYVRLLKDPTEARTMDEKPKPFKVQRVNDRWVKVAGNYVGTKVGLAGDILAARIGDRVFVIERTAGNDDPDLEKSVAAQVYFSDARKTGIDANTYAELELIGPTKSLSPGQSATLETTWKILTPQAFDRLLSE